MDRRGFLQIVGVGVATIAVPVPQLLLVEPGAAFSGIDYGLIRETCYYYDVDEMYMIRLDAFCPKKDMQWHVDSMIPASKEDAKMRANYLGARQTAQTMLRDILIREGITPGDLKMLKPYAGYVQPAWMRAT